MLLYKETFIKAADEKLATRLQQLSQSNID